MPQLRLTRFAVLAVILVPLTGCPLGRALPGLWLFFLDSSIDTLGLELLMNGQTEHAPIGPNGVQDNFTGTLTWSQRGNDITITQDAVDAIYIYSGAVTNGGTAMSGTYLQADGNNAGEVFGTWSAVRVEE